MADMLIKLEADATGWHDNLRCEAPYLRDGWAVVPAALEETVRSSGGVVELTVGEALPSDFPEIQDRRTDRSGPYPAVTAMTAGTYVPPPGPTEEELAAALEAAKAARQEENKAALAQWLAAHPLTWTDGKQYGVEEQDQNEMALNLMQYQAALQAGQTAPLEWHAQKEACREFTQEEYLGLSMAISAYVYPYRRYQETVKEDIYAAETAEEVAAVVIDYAGVTHD